MSWVSINEDLCDGCGFCMVRCTCFSKQNGKMTADAGIENCNLCGHCVSLCPTNAIHHGKMDMNNFKEIDSNANFDRDAFIEFIRSRRSHRHFMKKEIPGEDLDRLIDVCRYSPTGGNLQGVEITVVSDRKVMEKLSNLTVDVFVQWGEASRTEMKRLEAEGKEIDPFLQRLAIYGVNLDLARHDGKEPIFHNAPAVMIFHGKKGPGSIADDCLIASTTVSLTARTMGIESTYIGLFKNASRGHENIYGLLQLPEDHQVHSVLAMGYPRLRYLRAVDRRPVKTKWI